MSEMTIDNTQFAEFIADIYTATGKIELTEYRHWALTQLQNQVQFDAALWSNGHQQTMSFHNHTLFNIDQSFTQKLLDYLSINPLADVLLKNLGSPIDMKDLIEDNDFYQSEIYLKCFKPFGIQRILSSMHLDERTGLFTLLTLYRFERDKAFSQNAKQIHRQALFHLLRSDKHALFMQLEHQRGLNKHSHKAICDQQGYYHQMQDSFADLVEQSWGEEGLSRLPIDIVNDQTISHHHLNVYIKAIDELYLVEVWPQGPLDQLSVREQQVVQTLQQGLTFKQAAKQLELSPSTVSNHLYRIYKKLNVGSKAELLKLLS
ncbi:helix-turn-helix domain-containing protein [Thalassotalea crassostreae]|uniref:helix-turn-helix domain-containing protein n=1 Tax=Thalassotalea crassostreae TaxID=1763536 RepID=UPI00083980B5|nr:helix-turn-helix transcriptional regulator [Thalassotalea crassostreae]